MTSNHAQRAAATKTSRLQARLRQLHKSNRKMVRKWGLNGPANKAGLDRRIWLEVVCGSGG